MLNKDILIGFGVGLLTGGGAGVLIATKQAEARADLEIKSVKEAFAKLHADTANSLQEADNKIHHMTEMLGNAGYSVVDDEVRVPDEQLEELRLRLTEGPPIAPAPYDKVRVEKENDELLEFLPEDSKAKIYKEQEKIDLHGDKPYVITVDQFQDEHVSGPDEHEKQTVTYFAGDNKLVDSRDQIIRKVEQSIPLKALERFGEGSEEPHIVYVRNCWMCVDFEVVRDPGKYADYITGQADGWENEDVDVPTVRMRTRE